MNRLESHCDLELTRNHSRELHGRWTDGARMGLHSHAKKRLSQFRDLRQILQWHRAAVEEVARVVQLEAVRQWLRRVEHITQLRDERTRRRWAINCPSPQIAERTCVRTFRACEKHGKGTVCSPVGAPLLLHERPVRLPRVNGRLSRPETPNPPVGGQANHTVAGCSVSKCRR